jgi:uncharacterized protein
MSFSLYAATVPSYIQILGAIGGLIDKAEAFCSEKGLMPEDILQARLAADMHPFAYQVKSTAVHSLGAIEAIKAAEIDSFVGRDMRFAFGDRHLDFTAENFLLSFSQPNFYFHATTTYDILRWKGIPIGKRDFTGKTRTKR